MGFDCQRGQCSWTLFGRGCRGVEAQIERQCMPIIQGEVISCVDAFILVSIMVDTRLYFLYQFSLIQVIISFICRDAFKIFSGRGSSSG